MDPHQSESLVLNKVSLESILIKSETITEHHLTSYILILLWFFLVIIGLILCIFYVVTDSDAELVGVQRGDVITKINGQNVQTATAEQVADIIK